MKKFLSLLLCLTLSFSFSGCSREKKNIAIAEHINYIENVTKIANNCVKNFQKGKKIIESVSPDPMKPVTDNSQNGPIIPENDTSAEESNNKLVTASTLLNFYAPMEGSQYVDRQGFHIRLEPIDETHGKFHLGVDYWAFISKDEFNKYKKEYKLDFTYEEYAERRATTQPNYVAVLIDPETGKLSFDVTKQVEYTSTFSYTWNESKNLMMTTWVGAETIELFGEYEYDRVIDGTYATYTLSNLEMYPKKFDYH